MLKGMLHCIGGERETAAVAGEEGSSNRGWRYQRIAVAAAKQ